MTRAFDNGDEHSCCINAGKFLTKLRACKFSTEDCAPWS